jgi:hypothetical protein
VLASDKVVVLCTMGNIVFILKLGEVMNVKVNLTFVIIYQECHHVIDVDQTLQLRLLIDSQCDLIVIVFIYRLHGIRNLATDIELYHV